MSDKVLLPYPRGLWFFQVGSSLHGRVPTEFRPLFQGRPSPTGVCALSIEPSA